LSNHTTFAPFHTTLPTSSKATKLDQHPVILYAALDLLPEDPEYWDEQNLTYLNNRCYLAAIAFPSTLTRYSVDRYIQIVNLPIADPGSDLAEYRIVHLAYLLLRIQNNVRLHANQLRKHFLRDFTHDIVLRDLAHSYRLYLESIPTPPWP